MASRTFSLYLQRMGDLKILETKRARMKGRVNSFRVHREAEMMWKRAIHFPSRTVFVDDITEAILEKLDAKEVDELAGRLLTFHKPARRLSDEFDMDDDW